MKRNLLVSLSVLLLLSVSSAVFAVGPDPFDAYADCYGWSMGGIMHFGSWDHIDYYYRVSLIQGDDTIQTYSGTGTVYEDGDPSFLIEGDWGMELCGDYTMYLYTQWIGQFGPGVKRREATFTCDCVLEGCTYTPGYWKNHPEDWPVMDLTVGCVDYSQRQLLRIFDKPTRGDMTIKMFHHLVAAKLNVLAGADDYIMSAIGDGDDFLCMYHLGSKPNGDRKKDAEAIKNELAAYNEIPCYDETPDVMLSIEGPAAMEKAAATEESSWGSIKMKHN